MRNKNSVWLRFYSILGLIAALALAGCDGLPGMGTEDSSDAIYAQPVNSNSASPMTVATPAPGKW